MDACVVNWEYVTNILVAIISAGIPSIVAYIIYKNWKNQKGSEVVAIEAKQFIINLAKLQRLQSEIHKIIFISNEFHGANQEIEEFKTIKKVLNDSNILLGEALKDLAISNYSSMVMSQAMVFEKDIDKYKRGGILLNQVQMIDPYDAKIISDIYLEYALYRKTI